MYSVHECVCVCVPKDRVVIWIECAIELMTTYLALTYVNKFVYSSPSFTQAVKLA